MKPARYLRQFATMIKKSLLSGLDFLFVLACKSRSTAEHTCIPKGIMNSANMWSSSFLPRLWQYFLSVILIASITAIFFALRDVLDTTLVALLYLIPLGMITAFWGLGPGITGALITFLTFNYFFIKPYYTFAVHQPSDVVILIVFLIVAVVISQLVGRAQAGLAAATAREREATQLYELSTALTGLHDDHTSHKSLQNRCMPFHKVSMLNSISQGQIPLLFICLKSDPPARPPELIVPIQAARGALGEIRLWRARQLFHPVRGACYRHLPARAHWHSNVHGSRRQSRAQKSLKRVIG